MVSLGEVVVVHVVEGEVVVGEGMGGGGGCEYAGGGLQLRICDRVSKLKILTSHAVYELSPSGRRNLLGCQ